MKPKHETCYKNLSKSDFKTDNFIINVCGNCEFNKMPEKKKKKEVFEFYDLDEIYIFEGDSDAGK